MRWPFLLMLFVILSVMVHIPSSKCGFELDAHYVVENNPLIKKKELWKDIFRNGYFSAYNNSFNPQLNYYRPISVLSFALDYQWIGKKPICFRLVNYIIHGLNAFLMFLFFYLLFKRKDVSVAAGLIFCLLPVQEWAVNYIVSRGYLLQVLFSTITLICTVLYAEKQKFALYAAAIFSFMLALLSREAAIVLPLFISAAVFCYLQLYSKTSTGKIKTVNQYLNRSEIAPPSPQIIRTVLTWSLPFYLMAIVFYLLRQKYFPIINFDASNADQGFDMLTWLSICLQYQTRFFFPWTIFSPMGKLINNVWFCLIWLGFFFYILSRRINKRSLKESKCMFWFGVVWLILGCLSLWPVKHTFVKLGTFIAEYHLYFTSAGFALLLSQWISSFEGKTKNVILAVVLLFYGSISFISSFYWTSEETLLRRVYQMEKSKEAVAYRQLLSSFEQDTQALKEMIIKSQTDAERSLWSKQLGRAYRLQNRVEDAVKILHQSLEYNPKNYEAMLEMALCYLNTDHFAEGKQWLERIISENPNIPDSYRILAEACYYHQEYGQAIKNFEKALFLNPDYETIWQFLFMSYFFNGDKDKQQEALDKIEKSSLNIKDVMRFFIREFYHHGENGRVIDLINQNEKLFSRDSEILNIMAQAYFNNGKKERGRSIWKYILSFDPQNKDALNGMMTQ